MIRDIHTLSVSELKDLFIRTSRRFVMCLEVGASFEELHQLKEDIKTLYLAIEEKSNNESGSRPILVEEFNFN